jgi:hypothetical protein
MMILAIDLGRRESLSCEFDTVNGDYRFTTFDTTVASSHRVLTRMEGRSHHAQHATHSTGRLHRNGCGSGLNMMP